MGKGVKSKGAGLGRAVRRSLGKRVRRAALGEAGRPVGGLRQHCPQK